MALLVPNHGEGDGLKAFVAHTAMTNLVLGLYSNNVTPAETDTAASYTAATFAGYAAITLTGASWTITEGAPSSAAYAQQTFTRSSSGVAESIYGYFMTRLTGGRIALAERFASGPYSIANLGDAIKVTPNITMD